MGAGNGLRPRIRIRRDVVLDRLPRTVLPRTEHRFRGPHLGFDMPPLFPRPWHGLI